MSKRVLTWVGVLVLGTVLAAGATGLLVGWTGSPAADCQGGCYTAKSRAYQACRQISSADREGRERCFREADAALARCLRGCK